MIERGNPKRKLDRWKDILYFQYINCHKLQNINILHLLCLSKKGRKIHVN